MKIAILLNRDRARLRALGKSLLHAGDRLLHGRLRDAAALLPEYDSFARLLCPRPLYLGTGDPIPWAALQRCDLLIWEWGWTAVPARTVLEIKRRIDIPLLMFTGPPERWWREVESADLRVQLEAARATEAVGVMLKDMVAYYEALLPRARVFHMPAPVDVPAFARFALPIEQRRRARLFLTAPTRFTGPASRLPIATYLVFARLLAERADLEGVCAAYDAAERDEARRVFAELGIAGRVRILPYRRNLYRYFRSIASCHAGVFLPYGLALGRVALANACLGIPMVLSDEIETHRFLFPHTTVRWYGVDAAVDRCRRLLDDDTFHAQVRREALERAAYYSVERCRARMLDGLGWQSAPAAVAASDA